MKNVRLACLTPLGLLAGLFTLLAIVVSVAAQGGGLFSPGPLNAQRGSVLGSIQSHADTGGDCAACHTAPWDETRMMDRCLVCHTQIQTDLNDPRSLHGTIIQASNDADCLECHTEHHGPLAELTRVDIDNFPHDTTGFSLQSHARHPMGERFSCQDCHADRPDGRRFEPVADQACDDCHNQLDAAYMEQHRLAFSGACQNCHDGVDRFSAFDHNQLVLPLENAHGRLECQACHQQQDTPAALGQTSYECIACHAKDDQHNGTNGSQCVLCHTTSAWDEVIYDHAVSRFPLAGAHAQLPCTSCHEQAYRGTPTDCFACHAKDDHHDGSFGTDCQLCHTPNAWNEIIFDHATSRFPLTGMHQGLPCASCHAQGYQGTPMDCFACHAQDDHHDGTFGTECQLCHTPNSWSEIIFDHATSRFPLTGAHAGLPCSSCHQQAFRGTPLDCSACHQEPAYHAGLFQPSCADCHTTSAWLPAHYPLAHSFPRNHGDANSCRDCHTGSLAAYTCYTCHDQGEILNEHQDEVISDLANCARCHPDGTEEGAEGGNGDDDQDDD